jgi:L-amino acid N-acyltransferase YncA/predicted GNAT family acetyltransferase
MMRQSTLPLTFREFEESDYERIVEIFNANYPDYTTSVNELRHTDESLDRSKFHFKRYVCIDPGSRTILGFGSIKHSQWMFHPQKFWVDVQVDPKYQGRGVGSQIYDKLTQDLGKLQATTGWAMLKEDMPKTLTFAKNLGFTEKKRAWESRLTPSEVDVASFQKYADKASNEGIKITTLSEEQTRGPDSLRELYTLFQELMADMPLPVPYTPVSYEQWESSELKNPSLIPDCYFIASDGPRYVGLSAALRSDKEPKTLYQILTGVKREYRHRGLAIALKLKIIDFAKRNQYDKIKTWNDTDNAPMLAVNTKLGFKREAGWITMEKNLG